MVASALAKISDILSDSIHFISDHGNFLASKLLSTMGVVSMTGGAVVVATDNAQHWQFSDWGTLVWIVCSLCGIVKWCVDIYFAWRKNARNETEE